MFKIPYQCQKPEKCQELIIFEWNEHNIPACNKFKQVLTGKLLCNKGENKSDTS